MKDVLVMAPSPACRQRTLRESVALDGVGLHSGTTVHMVLMPAPPGDGVSFVRTDVPGRPRIKAVPGVVVRTLRCTTLGDGNGVEVQTTEHLLAALAGLGVDNCRIELSGPEVPVGDGSAALFSDLILGAGIVEQSEPRHYLELTQPIWVGQGDTTLVALPAPQLKLSYVFTNPHPAVGNLFVEYVIEPGVFRSEIAPARTLAFAKEIEALQRQGLGLGGNLDAVVVIDESGYVNERRFPDEVARHKVLDLLGDISLLGPLKAHIIGMRSGHAANAELTKAIYRSVSAVCLG